MAAENDRNPLGAKEKTPQPQCRLMEGLADPQRPDPRGRKRCPACEQAVCRADTIESAEAQEAPEYGRRIAAGDEGGEDAAPRRFDCGLTQEELAEAVGDHDTERRSCPTDLP